MNDKGESLIESLMTMVIIGIVGTAIMAISSAVIKTSKMHGDQAVTSVNLRNLAEKVTYKSGCPTISDFGPNAIEVKFWNDSSFVTTCVSNKPEQVTLQVITSSPNQPVETQSLSVVVVP